MKKRKKRKKRTPRAASPAARIAHGSEPQRQSGDSDILSFLPLLLIPGVGALFGFVIMAKGFWLMTWGNRYPTASHVGCIGLVIAYVATGLNVGVCWLIYFALR
jgi:hypothetical protein